MYEKQAMRRNMTINNTESSFIFQKYQQQPLSPYQVSQITNEELHKAERKITHCKGFYGISLFLV